MTEHNTTLVKNKRICDDKIKPEDNTAVARALNFFSNCTPN